MSQIAQRIRTPVNFRARDGLTDLMTGRALEAWVGTNIVFEIGLFDGPMLATDLANISSITLEVFDKSRTGPALMTRTIAAADLNSALTQEDWDAGASDDAHARFEFAFQETNLAMDGQFRKEFWLVISLLTNDEPVRLYTLGGGTFTLLQDATPADQEGPVQGGNLLPGGVQYDGSGEYTLTGLTPGKLYQWTPGVHDLSLVNDGQTLVTDAIFTAAGESVLLTGTPNTAVTAIIRASFFLPVEEADARYLQRTIRAWDSSTQYLTDRLVTNQGGVWIALQDNLNAAPPTLPTTANSNWLLILAPGATGATGATGSTGATGPTGAAGVDGDDGWAPVLAVVTDSARRVLKLVDWTGGTGTKPAINKYIGAAGLVDTLANGVDIRGPAGTDGGSGDMILSATQTVTGPKTFSANTLKVNNATNTFAHTIQSTATANRVIGLPDKDGIARLAPEVDVTAYASSISLDFALQEWPTITLTGNVAFTSTNRSAGRMLRVKINTDSTERLTSWPTWKWIGEPAPATIAASATGILELFCYGTTEASIAARWMVEGSSTSCEAVTVAAAGTTTINPKADFGHHVVDLTVNDSYGSTPYTREVILKRQNASAGDHVWLLVNLAATTNPTIEVYDDDTDDDPLTTVQGKTFAVPILLHFHYDGSAWVILSADYLSSAQVGNEWVQENIAYASTVNVNLDQAARQNIMLTGNITLGTLSTSRPPDGTRFKEVLIVLTASGGTRTIALVSGIKVAGSAATSLASGEKCLVAIHSGGPNESDTIVGFSTFS